MEPGHVTEWLKRYVDIWRAGDQERVNELFTDDAVYYLSPFREPKRGLAEIAEYWRLSGDAPDAFEAAYDLVGAGDDFAIATGFSRYFDDSRKKVDKEYANLFILRFAEDGRCRDYREWWMEKPEVAAAAS